MISPNIRENQCSKGKSWPLVTPLVWYVCLMWLLFFTWQLCLSGIWQGLWLRTNTKFLFLFLNENYTGSQRNWTRSSYINHSRYNREHIWKVLYDDLKQKRRRRRTYALVSYNFCISTPIMKLEMTIDPYNFAIANQMKQ